MVEAPTWFRALGFCIGFRDLHIVHYTRTKYTKNPLNTINTCSLLTRSAWLL